MTASGSKAFRAWKLAHSQRSLQRRNLDAEGHVPLGSSVRQAHKLKQSGLGNDSNRCYFFSLENMKMPYLVQLTSINVTKSFFRFNFPSLCRAYNSAISLKFSQSSEIKRAMLFCFSAPIPLIQERANCELTAQQKQNCPKNWRKQKAVKFQAQTQPNSLLLDIGVLKTLLPLTERGVHTDKGVVRRSLGNSNW